MHFSPPYLLFPENPLCAHLHPTHLADLRASGLSDDTIRAGNVYSLAPRFIEHFVGGGVSREIESAMCFPYQGGNFARIKLFPPLGKMKYAQPANTSAHLYVPFSIKDDTLYIAEGEKKTLAAYQHGLNAVGIGGVWNWISKGKPIDDLTLIQWEDREAVIVPDSDVWERLDLLRAIYAFGRELRNQGATVQIAQIPHGNAKVGLDDFLLAGGDIEDLETFGLGQSLFRSCQFWYGRWRLKSALEVV